ncbi:MAG: hypothetical protein Q9216_005523 [Gyalolechia sp. 2 TL-2023]
MDDRSMAWLFRGVIQPWTLDIETAAEVEDSYTEFQFQWEKMYERAWKAFLENKRDVYLMYIEAITAHKEDLLELSGDKGWAIHLTARCLLLLSGDEYMSSNVHPMLDRVLEFCNQAKTMGELESTSMVEREDWIQVEIVARQLKVAHERMDEWVCLNKKRTDETVRSIGEDLAIKFPRLVSTTSAPRPWK